jgi:hypothetical protein
MQTVITTNNAYDTILLIDENEQVVSRWDADKQTVADYVRHGANADDWAVGEWPNGFAPDQQDTEEAEAELRTVAAYGEEYGRNGKIDNAERREFWGVAA